MMRYPFLWLLGAWTLLLLNGCCKSCDPADYGFFPVQSASRTWVGYANSQVLQRTFRNYDSIDKVLSYSYLLDGVNAGIAVNCKDLGMCGLCCDSYSEGYLYTGLSDGGTITISLAVVKDFSANTYTDSAQLVPDMLEVTGGSGAPIQIRPGTTPATFAALKIYGRTFADVYQWGTPADPLTPVPAPVSAVYFTAKDGVVGYVTGSGILYGLVR